MGAGFGLGVLCMAGVYGSPAFAQLSGVPTRTISMNNRESVAELHNLDQSYQNLAEFVAPAVVDIRSTNTGRHMGADGTRVPSSGGEGSGFIFRPDGYIITNDHVVGGFDEVKVVLKNGREYPGKVTRAQDSDIALVKIDASNLPTLALGDSSKLRTGQIVMAVGAPFGLKQSMSFGHVSALGRESEIENRLYPDLIQTDASINMGNSGGPLVNIDGQVIGVDTSILSPSGTSAGIGFAIPSNQVRFIADMLVNKGAITRSMLGLIPTNLEDYQRQDMHLPNGGALVKTVTSDGPAAAAGIKKGDVITRVGSTPINTELDLRNAMLVYAPGTSVPVTYVRDGGTHTVNIKLVAYKLPPAPKQTNPFDNGQGGPNFQFPKGFDFKQFGDPFGDNGGPGFGFPQDGNGQDGNGRGGNGQGNANPFADGKIHLGVTVGNVTEDARSQYHIPASVQGAVVAQVMPGTPGAGTGLQAGDVIVKFGDKTIGTANDLIGEMQKVKHGDTRTIHYIRYSDNGKAEVIRTVTFK